MTTQDNHSPFQSGFSCPQKPILMALSMVLSISISTVGYAQSIQTKSIQADDVKVSHHTTNQLSTSQLNNSNNSDSHDQPTLSGLNQLTKAQQDKIPQLAESVIWRRLLYYPDKKANKKSQQQSEVSHTEFFVAKDGQHDPYAEMLAMLQVLLSPADSKLGNQSVQCRFPARSHWLKQQLNLTEQQVTKADCEAFDKWFANLEPEQLSVVFAEEYPDNPPSAFAHTLLRIDNKTEQDNTAYALNYTVKGNADDPFIKYLTNSIDGGYPAMMTIEPYNQIMEKYLNRDGRDVWLYRLDLSVADVQQIMRHVWEVQDLHLPYYFLTDNCSSEILRLIDIVRPTESLFKEVTYTAIPSDIIRLLQQQNFIRQSQYIPAKNSQQQYQKYQQKAHQNKPHQMINPADNNPITGVPVRRAMLGIGQTAGNPHLDIGLRASYHDMLDNPSGVRQFLDLQGIDGTIRLSQLDENNGNHGKKKTKLTLQELTILQARIFNPVNTARKGTSWGGHVRLTQAQDGSQPLINYSHESNNKKQLSSHLVASAGAEYGKSWAFGQVDKSTGKLPPQLCYVLGTGTGQVGKGLTHYARLGIGANLGCVYQINPRLRTQAQVNLPYWFHGGHAHYWQPIAKLGVQYDLDNQQAIRLQAQHQWNDPLKSKPAKANNKGSNQDNNSPQNFAQNEVTLSWVKYF